MSTAVATASAAAAAASSIHRDYEDSQEDVLLRKLSSFYREPVNLHTMLDVITGRSRISLRIIDWFVTNYAKKNNVVLIRPPKDPRAGHRFKVYSEYKSQLKSDGKLRFDPFCRWKRIYLPYAEGRQQMETTIGQLNFFMWILNSNILAYIEEFYEDIEDDMKSRGSMSKRKNAVIDELGVGGGGPATDAAKTRKKREELSISATKNIIKEEVEIVLKFT